jgi:N,N'-diacetyllegionaminate synthase
MSAAPFVIAEAGVNHNGDVSRALQMIDVAKKSGVDAVKFQAFQPEELVAAGTATAAYQAANTGLDDQLELLRRVALTREQFAVLAHHCAEVGVEFLCTAFDVEFVQALAAMGMRRVKVASGELTNNPALRRFAALKLPVVLSTGMATLEEVESAVAVLRQAGSDDITLLHCTSLYPAPNEVINLKAIATMRAHFKMPVGYSDHSLGDHVAIAAVALGACVIEKHFTLDRALPGPDHKASLEPDELKAFVDKLHSTAAALGDGIKKPVPGERETAMLVRRSWHATRPLKGGTVLTAGDVTLKRPASGLSPAHDLIGRTLSCDRAANQPIRSADLV